MPRYVLWIIGLLIATTVPSGGCRSCSSCHDYDPPVANCEGNACGCHRAGSVSSGYVPGGHAGEEYSSGEYVESQMAEPSVDEAAGPRDSR